jgi:hypothetical protein
MILLLGTLLQLLTPINLSAYKESLQPFATKDFFQDVEYHYDNILEKLNQRTLPIRRRHFDALFLINVFSDTKYCPSVLETVSIRVPTRNIRNFTTFSCSFSHCLTARCISAANAVCKSTDIFSKSCFSLKSLSHTFVFVLLFFVCFVLCCLSAVVCIRADSVIGHSLLSSARE